MISTHVKNTDEYLFENVSIDSILRIDGLNTVSHLPGDPTFRDSNSLATVVHIVINLIKLWPIHPCLTFRVNGSGKYFYVMNPRDGCVIYKSCCDQRVFGVVFVNETDPTCQDSK